MQSPLLTALTPSVQANMGLHHVFKESLDFRHALAAVEADMTGHPQDRHMIVICTHGREDTGTWLAMDDGPYPVLDGLFGSVAAETLIYMAVCWGGYTGPVTRIQAGCAPTPVVVGALEPLTGAEGNDLQDQLIAVVAAHGIDEGRLTAVVTNFNAVHLPEYATSVARIALRDRSLVPAQGRAGIAWSLLRDARDAPYVGPFEVTAVRASDLDLVDTRGERWSAQIGWLRVAKGAEPVVGDRFTFKSKRNETAGGTVLKILPPATHL